MLVTPNLHFERDCAYAISLYQEAFGAEIKTLITGEMANPADYTASDAKKLIYHAEISIGGQQIFLTDCLDDSVPAGNTASLLLTFDSQEEVMSAFEKLRCGARVLDGPCATSYSPVLFRSLTGTACGGS